jgi:hypothetical protein
LRHLEEDESNKRSLTHKKRKVIDLGLSLLGKRGLEQAFGENIFVPRVVHARDDQCRVSKKRKVRTDTFT